LLDLIAKGNAGSFEHAKAQAEVAWIARHISTWSW
jgi:hypothetical protein